MDNTIRIALFVNSNCDTCKLMQHELMDNPPKGELVVINVGRQENAGAGWPYKNQVKIYPTTVVYTYPNPYTIAWFEGFVDTETIDESIQNYIDKLTIK